MFSGDTVQMLLKCIYKCLTGEAEISHSKELYIKQQKGKWIRKSQCFKHFVQIYPVKSFWHASSSCRNRMQGAWKRCGFPREHKHCCTISRTLHTLTAWALVMESVCTTLQMGGSKNMISKLYLMELENANGPTLDC